MNVFYTIADLLIAIIIVFFLKKVGQRVASQSLAAVQG